MQKAEDKPAISSPILEFAAKGITDPVLRLRFLKHTAPVPSQPGEPGRSKRYRMIRIVAIPVLLGALMAAAFLIRTGVAVRPIAAAAPASVVVRPVATPAAP